MSRVQPTSALANPDNYYWVLAEEKFMYLPTRTLFARGAVMRQLSPAKAKQIEIAKGCSNLFWAPGYPTLVKDKACVNGILYDSPGNNLLNTYMKPPPEEGGDPDKAKWWLELGAYLFGQEDLHDIIQCLAFKVQHPGEKINHALVIGSTGQGIGKDSFLAPVQRAVGAFNWQNISAAQAVEWTQRGFTSPILSRVITRISEAHDLGAARFKFYDMTKDWAAAPPEYITVSDKNVKAYAIANVVLPIYSTNHLTDGLYWPAEDRRNDFKWSDRVASDFQTSHWRGYFAGFGYQIERDDEKKNEFWKGYWEHLKRGADIDVAAYLRQPHLLDGFNPGTPPRHTAAWDAVVAANSDAGDGELLDVLDTTGIGYELNRTPDRMPALTIDELCRAAGKVSADVALFFGDRRNSRKWAHRLERAGYIAVRNPDAKDGLWKINNRRQMIYAQRELGADKALRWARQMAQAQPRAAAPAPSDEEAFGYEQN